MTKPTARLRRLSAAWIILVTGAIIISALIVLLFPEKRTGPFGIGLPAELISYSGRDTNFTISYPQSWVLYETPQGNHGDEEIFAFIAVPGRSFPRTILAKRENSEISLNEVELWSKQRAAGRPDYVEVSFDPISSSGGAGYVHKYIWYSDSFLLGEDKIVCKDFSLLSNGMLYLLSNCAGENDWPMVEPVFEKMFSSFEVN